MAVHHLSSSSYRKRPKNARYRIAEHLKIGKTVENFIAATCSVLKTKLK